MANVDAAFGMIPVGYADGRPYVGEYVRCYIAAAEASGNMFIGDPVLIAGDADTDGVPTVTLATAGATNKIFGSIVNIECDTADALRYRAALTARYVHVATADNLLYKIQEDSDVSTLAATNVGQNADLVAGTGSTVTGKSAWELNSNTANTTNNLQVRIHRLYQAVNNIIGTNAIWLVSINLPQGRDVTGI